jgi:hypothetical protein
VLPPEGGGFFATLSSASCIIFSGRSLIERYVPHRFHLRGRLGQLGQQFSVQRQDAGSAPRRPSL